MGIARDTDTRDLENSNDIVRARIVSITRPNATAYVRTISLHRLRNWASIDAFSRVPELRSRRSSLLPRCISKGRRPCTYLFPAIFVALFIHGTLLGWIDSNSRLGSLQLLSSVFSSIFVQYLFFFFYLYSPFNWFVPGLLDNLL